MLNRKQRRSIGGLKVEARHKIRIADMQVMVNDNVPVGYMIVSPEDEERLAKMIEQASAKAHAEKAKAIKATKKIEPEKEVK